MSVIHDIFLETDCPSMDRLTLYIQHQLSADEIRTIELHIASCPLCNDAIDGLMLSDINDLTHDLPAIREQLLNASPTLTYKKTNQPEPNKNSSPKKNSFHIWSRWAVAASILFIMGLGAWGVFKLSYKQNQSIAIHTAPHTLPIAVPPDAPVNGKEIAKLAVPNSPSNEPKSATKSVSRSLPPLTAPTINSVKKIAEEVKNEATQPIQRSIDQDEVTSESDAPQQTLIESQAYHDNYKTPTTASLKEKSERPTTTFSPGMSKNNQAPQVVPTASNQLNYISRNQDLAPENENIAVESAKKRTVKNVTDNLSVETDVTTAKKYFDRGQYKKAINRLEQFLLNNPNNVEAKYMLAVSYFFTNQIAQSQSLAKTFESNTYFYNLYRQQTAIKTKK